MGDVLLAGPALRAIARTADVVLVCGPRGEDAARLLPGLARVVCAELPWIEPEPKAVSARDMHELIDRLAAVEADEAVIFTSFHQSPLPLALLMRIAGVRRVSAISADYPGSLLDVRHGDPGEVHEVQRALSLVEAAGFGPVRENEYNLRIVDPGAAPAAISALDPYVIVHPSASVPARCWPIERSAELVRQLHSAGWNVVVTGDRFESRITARVAGSIALDTGGRLTLRQLAAALAGAEAVVAPNTGPAHLAAAVGTPVVSLFSPVVSAARWRPWGVAQVLLGDQEAACAGSRARQCPIEGHPCLTAIRPEDVVEALTSLVRQRTAA
jgi:ADP-heptose:LPS heptosyltransferase